jgi:hypothetical protein
LTARPRISFNRPAMWVTITSGVDSDTSVEVGDRRFVIGRFTAVFCDPGEDRQGKIRPVALALPVIRAAESDRSWTTPYVVKATGKESFSLLHWAGERPTDSCGYTPVDRYPPTAQSYTAVFQVSGMAPGEDLAFVAFHAGDQAATPHAFDEFQSRWSRTGGDGSSCYWVTFALNQGAGSYSLRVFAGPNLAPASGPVTDGVATG